MVRGPVWEGTWDRLPPTEPPLRRGRGRTRVILTGGRDGASTARDPVTPLSRDIRRRRRVPQLVLLGRRLAPRDQEALIRISIT